MCCCHGGVSGYGGKGGFHGGRCGFHLFGFLPWGGGVAIGFGLGMFFVVVVVADLGFDIYIILLCRYIILMSRIEK